MLLLELRSSCACQVRVGAGLGGLRHVKNVSAVPRRRWLEKEVVLQFLRLHHLAAGDRLRLGAAKSCVAATRGRSCPCWTPSLESAQSAARAIRSRV